MSNIENNSNQQVQTNEAKNPSASKIKENKNLVIIIAVVIFVLLLAVIPILLNIISEKNNDVDPDVADTGLTLSGTYAENIGVGSSKYTFDGNKVTNVYNVNGETVTIEYTYVIAIEGGQKVIKLTSVGEDGVEKVSTHEFMQGKLGDTPYVSINDVMYLLSEE